MQLSHIAVVPIRAGMPVEEITAVSAALQKQVMRDFAPVWGGLATVDYFRRSKRCRQATGPS